MRRFFVRSKTTGGGNETKPGTLARFFTIAPSPAPPRSRQRPFHDLNKERSENVEVRRDDTMKKILLLTLTLSLSMAQVVRADNDTDNKKKRKHQAEVAAEQHSQQAAQSQKKVVSQPVKTRVQPVQPGAVPTQRILARSPHSVAPTQRQPVKSEANPNGQNRVRTQAPNQAENRNRRVDRNSFAAARTRAVHGYHNRYWWRSHYNTRFVFFGGGYYYWNLGYWCPAFGYSPFYNNYAYIEPIYGYNNLAPGQVIQNVQLALRDQGYYPGAIDGLIGTQTRAALSSFQRDHGLIVTSAVDEPTLVALGLA
jgi:Putative peptidoglycan binding domain